MITAQEIKSKQHLIVDGLDFYIPNHQKTALHKVVVTKRTLVDKTSCWGDYQKDMVFFQEAGEPNHETMNRNRREPNRCNEPCLDAQPKPQLRGKTKKEKSAIVLLSQ